MSEKKYVVPDGMAAAAAKAVFMECGVVEYHPQIRIALEAAIQWLSENPIVPSDKDADYLWDRAHNLHVDSPTGHASKDMLTEWQRRMFLAPEPKESFEEVFNLLTVEVNRFGMKKAIEILREAK